MQESAGGGQGRFAQWLRTGRWPDPPGGQIIERKFNPWHDPADGRFAFTGTGQHDGSGGQSPAERPARRKRTPFVPKGGSFGGAGSSGSFGKQAQPKPRPGPQGVQKRPGASPALAVPQPRPPVRPQPKRPVRTPPWRIEVRNGYKFRLDEQDKPRRIDVSRLSTTALTPRSRSAQRIAGKPDRLPTDEGGHYIAHRFNGPNDAFNHFAQDRSLNRGQYRTLENEWARAQAKGKEVSLAMTIVYPKGSRRPDFIHIWYNMGGDKNYRKIDNRPVMASTQPNTRKRK